MEPDQNAMLLSALVGEEPVHVPVQTKTLAEQKEDLIRLIDTVSTDDKRDIGNILVQHGHIESLQMCSSGTVVDLDALPADIVGSMHNLLMFKREKMRKI